MRASYLEIYNEEVRDLLSKQATNKLDLKEDPQSGVYVKDLTSYVVKTVRECDKLRDFGASNRHVGATKMNQVRSAALDAAVAGGAGARVSWLRAAGQMDG